MSNTTRDLFRSEGGVTFSLGDIWKAIKRRGWIALAAAVAAALIYYVFARSTYVPQYTATASLAVSVIDAHEGGSAYNNDLVAAQIARAFPKVLQEGLLKDRVALRLNRDALPGTVSASNVAETNLITLKASASNPQVAYALLEAVIEEYPQIAETLETSAKLTLLSADDVPQRPSNRITLLRVVEIGVIVGLLTGVAIVLLYIMFHRTVSNAEDMKPFTNARCLAQVPALAKQKHGRNSFLITQRRVSRNFVESIYRLRTAVERTDKQVLLVTSSLASEGKSTISVNLALSLAKNGKRVILIDCDLRHPLVSRYLGLPESACKMGLSNYLKGETSLDRIGLTVANMNNLIIVPGGSVMKNPSEVLSKPMMQELIATLRRQADYIVIDTPPCSVMADSAVAAQYADGVLYVVKEDFASQDAVARGIENVTMGNVPLIGFVINEVSHGAKQYGYDEYYYGHSSAT